MSASPWSYTRNQRRGLILLLLLLAGTYGLTRFLASGATKNFSAQDPAIAAAARQLRSAAPAEDGPAPTESFPFNPNTVSHADLQRLGLSDRQSTAWIRYRDKRPFRSASDINRLRVLRPEQARHLQSLARLPAPDTHKDTRPSPPPRSVERFTFDPNTVSADSLHQLGFTERETAALLRYREYRPVTFRRAEDLRRVRALDSNHLNDVLDLVRIALPQPAAPALRGHPRAAETTSDTTVLVDINRATVETWTQLPGIGPYRASRIVAYRDQLGGFAAVEQVATTYGLPDSVYTAIAPRLTSSPILRPLFINRLDAPTLSRHPLLKRSTATVIVRYRENHGPFRSADDLKKVRALSTETLQALLPYLNFDP